MNESNKLAKQYKQLKKKYVQLQRKYDEAIGYLRFYSQHILGQEEWIRCQHD